MERDTESTHVTKTSLGMAGVILGDAWNTGTTAVRNQSCPEWVRLPTVCWLKPRWVPLVNRGWQAHVDKRLPVPLHRHSCLHMVRNIWRTSKGHHE